MKKTIKQEPTPTQKVDLLLSLFSVNGVSADKALSPSQKDIFEAIAFQKDKRVQIITPTQYGKSMTVALACIVLACLRGHVVAVVAPKNEQARIIMRYFIEHIGDHPCFYYQLDKETKLDRLRQEENKERIILKNGGGIYVISAQAGNSRKGIQAAMGAGAKTVIVDEASLIPDLIEATVYRMIAGKGEDAFYCKIGNPFYRNHFHKTWYDGHNRYKKIFIDVKKGLEEGRYTEDFIKEAKTKPLYDVLYECKFPSDTDIDADGYRRLLSDAVLDEALIKEEDAPEPQGRQIIGGDIGRGRNFSTYVSRWDNVMKLLERNQSRDLMDQVVTIKSFGDVLVNIDDVGVGGGVVNRCEELDLNVRPVREGESAFDSDKFANIRAEIFWRLKEWIEQGGQIVYHPDFEQLREIKYKVNSSGRVIIEPKEHMRARGVESPDCADSASLSCYIVNEPTIHLL